MATLYDSFIVLARKFRLCWAATLFLNFLCRYLFNLYPFNKRYFMFVKSHYIPFLNPREYLGWYRNFTHNIGIFPSSDIVLLFYIFSTLFFRTLGFFLMWFNFHWFLLFSPKGTISNYLCCCSRLWCFILIFLNLFYYYLY